MYIGAGVAICPAVGTDRSVLKQHQGKEASASVMGSCLGKRLLHHSDGLLHVINRRLFFPATEMSSSFSFPEWNVGWDKERMKTKSRRKFYVFNINLHQEQTDRIVPISGLNIRWRKFSLLAIPSHPRI